MTTNPTVALLGTGIMGVGMARNIAKAGLPIRVWNRTRERAEPLGDVATVADTVAEAVEDADVVITMLYDADSVAETMEQARGHLRADAIWLQQSTVGVAGPTDWRTWPKDLGVTFVDAPVLGTKKPAEDGALVVLASGPGDDPADVRARLRRHRQPDACGSVTRVPVRAQAGGQLWVATVLEGIAESLAFARDLGLDPALFLDAVSGGRDGCAVRPAQGQEHARRQLRPRVHPGGLPQGRRPDPRGGRGPAPTSG